MFQKIQRCRICGNPDLVQVVDLGEQYLTGVFPKNNQMNGITKGPLRLVKCHSGHSSCGLIQLEHSYDLKEMYGQNYGYRSGLNRSMVSHLNSKVQKILSITSLKDDDLVIDIGSNDGTTLGFYPQNLDLVGIDPTALKFSKYYLSHIKLIPDFFTAEKAVKYFGSKKAKVVTSFSMFYDLEDPVRFASDISSILDPEHGVWVFEQSYMPEMLKMNSYDTICHEHLEYYSLAQIEWIANKANLKILDVELNNVNGGSFSITACVKTSKMKVNEASLNKMREFETASKLSTLEPYFEFSKRIMHSRAELIKFISNAKEEGKKIFGLGASTKGNVLLQYCGLSSEDIISIADVNPDKFGAFCPGSLIPIEDESKILARKPDYLLVLPWHFKEFFFKSNSFKGLKLVFPLPHLEIVEIAK